MNPYIYLTLVECYSEASDPCANQVTQKWHYVYYSYEEWGRGYIGRRSSSVFPHLDPYMGSFTDKSFKPTDKIVLAIFDSVEEAIAAEVVLHNYYKVECNPHFANQSRQTSSKFYCPMNLWNQLSPQQKFHRSEKISRALSSGGRGFYYKLTSPTGLIIVTLNLRKTCEEHNLHRGNLQKVLKGERRHSCGWTISQFQLP